MILSLIGFTFLLYGINVWAQAMPVVTTVNPSEQICNPRSNAYPGNDIVRNSATGLQWVRSANGIASRDPCFNRVETFLHGRTVANSSC